MSDLPRGGSLVSPDSDLPGLRASLLDHYDRMKRDLPWRGEADPYRIWVSEVMLQQTRVETVIPYYRRWIGLFPDVETLADATRDQVLLAWRGLGYYRRATNLHQGAQVVRERYEGRLPEGFQTLKALPGVGEYTAGAVASIAFGEVVPAVDGNVKRVLSRLFDQEVPTPAWLRRTAAALVDPRRPGDWNQALMELGATVCTPRSPACASCPWGDRCVARAAGTQDERPPRASKKVVPEERLAVAVVVDLRGRVLLVRRPEGGLLSGMWAFPEAALDGAAGGVAGGPDVHGGDVEAASEPGLVEAARGAARAGGATVRPAAARRLPPVRHRFTHLDATYLPVLLAGNGADAENRRWVTLDRRGELALPVAQEKIARAAEAALES